MKLQTHSTSSSSQRRARTRSLIQLGGLLERAGTLDVFGIALGTDLQTDPSMKRNVASLFKGLLELNTMATSSDVDLNLWALQGLDAFKSKKEEETEESANITSERSPSEKKAHKDRPLDRKNEYHTIQDLPHNETLEPVINFHQSKGG